MVGIGAVFEELEYARLHKIIQGDTIAINTTEPYNWRAGRRNPTNAKAVLVMLEGVLKKKRIPKQRRYAEGSRQRKIKPSGLPVD